MKDDINLVITTESKVNFNFGLLLNLYMLFETAQSANVGLRARPSVQLLIRVSLFIFGQVIPSFPI